MMPNEITEEMLRRFAELGGWTELDTPTTVPLKWGRHPNGELRLLSRFRKDLAACFEVLLYVCRKLETNFQLNGVGDCKSFSCYIGDAAAAYGGSGGYRELQTIEDTIIRAVTCDGVQKAVLASQKAEAQ